MILLGEVEGSSWSLVGFASSVELDIVAQLVVHSPTKELCEFGGGLIIYICCMVSTIEIFNFSSTSQPIINLFFFGFWSLNTYVFHLFYFKWYH
jgi:hypothetical protein